MKILTAETNLTSATNISNAPVVRIYNSDSSAITLTRKSNAGTTIGSYSVPSGQVIYCQKFYTDTLEGGAALKATGVGYSEELEIISLSNGGSSYVASGLVLYLDASNSNSYSGSGTSWLDLTDNDYDATIDGAAYSSDDGGIFDFDGGTDNVKIPNTAAGSQIGNDLTDGSNDFTFEVWFKADSVPANGGTNAWYAHVLLGGGTHDCFITFGDTLDDREVGIRIRIGSTWMSPVGSGADSIADNTWYNLIITYDSSSGWVLYLNGVQKSTSSTTGTFRAGREWDANNRLLGAIEDNNSISYIKDRFFDGKIPVLRIYDRVLTAAEATQNYDALKSRYGY